MLIYYLISNVIKSIGYMTYYGIYGSYYVAGQYVEYKLWNYVIKVTHEFGWEVITHYINPSIQNNLLKYNHKNLLKYNHKNRKYN